MLRLSRPSMNDRKQPSKMSRRIAPEHHEGRCTVLFHTLADAGHIKMLRPCKHFWGFCQQSEAQWASDLLKHCARGGTRTAFQPLQTLGTPENIPNPSQSGRCTARSEAQGVHNVHTPIYGPPNHLDTTTALTTTVCRDRSQSSPHCPPAKRRWQPPPRRDQMPHPG